MKTNSDDLIRLVKWAIGMLMFLSLLGITFSGSRDVRIYAVVILVYLVLGLIFYIPLKLMSGKVSRIASILILFAITFAVLVVVAYVFRDRIS